jgi:serine/threonine-protein kinase
VVPVQYYPNGPQTPEQEYQERARRYRDESVDFYRRQQQNIERGQGSNGGGYSRAPTSFGAIAYSADTGKHTSTQNHGSRGEAESKAKRECGENDCEIAAWFYDSCGALATDQDDQETWGGAQGANEARASQGAVARCVREGGKNCKVIATACSR